MEAYSEIEVSERDLEDWAVNNMAPLIHPSAVLLGRQVTLPSGKRLDLLFRHIICGTHYWTVVEMKAGEADVDAIVQCMGYVRELRKTAYNNVKVRGVVSAQDFSQDAYLIASEMQAMALLPLTTQLSVIAHPLYDQCWPDTVSRPPDVDETKPREWPVFPSHEGETVREVVDRLYREEADSIAKRQVFIDRVKRQTALVPTSLAPIRVAYPNGNGRR